MNTKELLQEAIVLQKKITELLEETGFEKYNDLCMIESDKTPDDWQIISLLRVAFDHLDIAADKIVYLSRKVDDTGTLRRLETDRYALGNYEYSCGAPIEFLFYDEDFDRTEWMLSRVEHDGVGYYIFGFAKLQMEGLTVRTRSIFLDD